MNQGPSHHTVLHEGTDHDHVTHAVREGHVVQPLTEVVTGVAQQRGYQVFFMEVLCKNDILDFKILVYLYISALL